MENSAKEMKKESLLMDGYIAYKLDHTGIISIH